MPLTLDRTIGDWRQLSDVRQCREGAQTEEMEQHEGKALAQMYAQLARFLHHNIQSAMGWSWNAEGVKTQM